MNRALSESDVSKQRSWDIMLNQLALAGGLVLVGMGQTLLYSLLGPAARQIGLTDVQTGSIVSVSALVLTFTSPLWGRFIDRSGSRRVFLIGMFSYAVGSLCFALVLEAGMGVIISATEVLTALILVRLIYAAMTAGIHPAAMANIALTTPSDLRPAKMGFMSACFGLGSILGPLLAAALGDYGLLIPLYIVAGLALCNVLLGYLVIKNISNPDDVEKEVLEPKKLGIFDPRINRGLLATVLVYIGFSALQQSIAFHVQDILHLNSADTVKQTGMVVFGLAVAMVVTQLGVIQYYKPGPRKSVVLGGTLAFLGFCFIASGAATVFLLTLCAALVGAGFAFLFPGIQGVLSGAVLESEQGSTAGLSFGAAALGYVIGPLIGTSLLAVGYGATYWCAAVLVAAGAVISTTKIQLN